MECIGKLIFISIVFFVGGWFARASKMEKKILEVNIKFENIITTIQASINEELKSSRIERDKILQQHSEILLLIEAYNKQNKEFILNEAEKNEAKLNLAMLKNNSIKND